MNGSSAFHSGVPRGHRRDPGEGELDLRVDRLLAPERAVVVEDSDPLLGRDEARARAWVGVADVIEHGLPGRPVVPRGQGVDLSCRGSRDSHARRGAEQEGGEFAPVRLHARLPTL